MRRNRISLRRHTPIRRPLEINQVKSEIQEGLQWGPGSDSYTDRGGHYNTQNRSASDGHPNPGSRVDSLMAEAALQTSAYAKHTSSPSSLEMIGWKDSDRDGIFDALDVPLTLTGTGSHDGTDDQSAVCLLDRICLSGLQRLSFGSST